MRKLVAAVLLAAMPLRLRRLQTRESLASIRIVSEEEQANRNAKRMGLNSAKEAVVEDSEESQNCR